VTVKKNLIVGIIRSIRFVTGLLLICAVPPFAFLFPFLFDDPKMENPLFRYSVFVLLAVVPILFLLTSRRTKTAVSQGNLNQGIFFSVAPFLGFLIITISWSPILKVIPDLTSYGPIHGQRGATLSIQLPNGCKIEDHQFRGNFPNANYNGTWLISNGVVSFKCNAGPYDGYLNVRPFLDLPSHDNPK
jgi:hypothetical protein